MAQVIKLANRMVHMETEITCSEAFVKKQGGTSGGRTSQAGRQNQMPGAEAAGGIALGFSPSMPTVGSAEQSPELGEPEFSNDQMMTDM